MADLPKKQIKERQSPLGLPFCTLLFHQNFFQFTKTGE